MQTEEAVTDWHLRRWYQRLVFRKGPQKAKAAVARKLAIRLRLMRGLLGTSEPYQDAQGGNH